MSRRLRPRRRRSGAPILVLLAVIVGLLVVADVLAKGVAEDELAARLHAKVPESGGTSAEIRSFPFLGRLLFSGAIPEIDATVRDVTYEGVRFDFITVEMHDVELDRDQLVANRRVALQRFERGQVRAEVAEDALADALGVPIQLEDGRAFVEIVGQRVGATLAVRNNQLVVGGIGASLPALGIQAPLLPCVANAEVRADRVVFTCDFTEIPPELTLEAEL